MPLCWVSGTYPVLSDCIYEPVTKGCDLKWNALPQKQTPNKLLSVLPLERGMFQATFPSSKNGFDPSVCCMASKLESGQVWTLLTMDTMNVNSTEKNHLYELVMFLVHLSSC